MVVTRSNNNKTYSVAPMACPGQLLEFSLAKCNNSSSGSNSHSSNSNSSGSNSNSNNNNNNKTCLICRRH